jgi:hypothetical protein
MNPLVHSTLPNERETLESRAGLRLAACLNAGAAALPHDVDERLRFAREQALARARLARRPQAQAALVTVITGRSTLALGGGPSWQWRLASLLPAVALVIGLVTIQMQTDKDTLFAAAEVDSALLTDDLPPSAYADTGFAEFLRSPHAD